MVSWRYWVGVATLLVGCTCFAQDRPRAEAHEGDWLSYGRTADEQRFSPLTQINHRTIGELRLAWSLDLERGARSLRGHTSRGRWNALLHHLAQHSLRSGRSKRQTVVAL